MEEQRDSKASETEGKKEGIIGSLNLWLPPILWMGFISIMSTDLFSASRTGNIILSILHHLFPWVPESSYSFIHSFFRKSGHLTEYMILASLWQRTLEGSSRFSYTISFLLSFAYAVLDEYHQSFVPSRTASPVDVLIDSTGAGIILIILWAHRGKGGGGI